MNREALACPKMYAGLLGSKLEDKVVEVLRQCAVDTCFEHQIMKYSGQRFPDIVVGGYYGVEVKTTKYNHWKSTGSSVAEGTVWKVWSGCIFYLGRCVNRFVLSVNFTKSVCRKL